MIFKDAVYIGIDPPSGVTAIPYAALDNELNVVAVSKGALNEVAAFVGGQKSAFVGINAPRQPNKGLMKKDKVRDALNPRPRPGRWESFRVAEYHLFADLQFLARPQLDDIPFPPSLRFLDDNRRGLAHRSSSRLTGQ